MDIKKNKTYSNFDEFCDYFKLDNIKNTSLFKESMTHSSISKKNYEKMEFLGDSILNFCISRILFEETKNKTESILSKKKSFLCSRHICRQVANDIHIQDYVIKTKNVNIDSVLADVVESLLCVIYYEFGIQKVYEIVENLFIKYLNSFQTYDTKTRIQEMSQKLYKKLPVYSLISKEGTENNPVFKISLSCGNLHTEGTGNSKKEAEKQAAKKMLILLKNK